ncbi:MAG: tail fiber domain-containing protein [Prosthecobacter sp.]|jgi:hypothetical protein|uniref:tail fiber domain-containing protein n=1 Tax=Prosthecobacter sp. TaxID=1965333 RepID=UPI0019FC6EED|nr:tail fiber domain-containing protein [Prosthecobacter sp.]MBE2281991.1 tail fiber domain-containing protein [Prosthecobacter sp.]
MNLRLHFKRVCFALLLFVTLHWSSVISSAAVPSLLNHQGRIAVNGTNFEGSGQFKFAFVNTDGTTSYWSNDGTSTAGSQPAAAVSLTVTKGLYAVLLGDTSLANMTAVPASVFDNADVRLRVWFNDGTNGFQHITPDQRLAAAPFAINAAKAESVPNGSITGAMLADGSVGSTKIVNGAVGTSQLAPNAVQAANIATGAVGSSQLAAGSVTTNAMADSAITTAKLAANFATGTAVEGNISSINNTSNVLSFSVPFPAPFATAPSITFGRPGWSPGSVTTTGFTATYAGYSPSLVATPGNASATSVASVSGRPAIAYYDNPSTTLKFAIAANRDGSGGWTILTLDAAGTGRDCSLIIVNGTPAVSYYDATNGDLKFVRALDATGSAWAAPQALDTTGNVGQHTCLHIINGSPAISYHDVTNGNLKFIRASDATGSTWGSPVVVDAAAGNVGQFTSLEVVGGNPAIAYYDATAGDLLYVRASDSNGTAWTAPASIDGAANNVGQHASLAVVGSHPAIAYHDVSNLDLKYVRALDATGSTWGTPLTIDSGGTVGLYSSLKIVNGLPMIASQGVDNARYSCRLWRNLSADSTGAWSFVVLNLFVPQTNAGQRNSLAAINGAPAVSYIESSTGKLQYATVPDFAWTAGDGTVSPILATAFSSPLAGDITGGQGSTTISGNAVDSAKIMDGSITNADINASAAIADSKLGTIATAGKVANSATTGTSANTPGTLVLRDAQGNFSAGTITGTFVGDGSGLTGLTTSQVILDDVVAAPLKPVVAWGDNDNGQTAVPALANVASVAAGSFHNIALLDAGTVVQWGAMAAVPGTVVNVTHIAAGTDHNLVRRSDGSVIAWGDDTFGQSSVPGGITTATNVAAGEKHSLILKADGTVQAWGDNTYGQSTIPGTATNITAIAAGADHNLALKADGTVIAWGRNDSGQTSVPGGLTNVVAIACGAYHSLAVRTDGTVVAWGWDLGGQVSGATGVTHVSKVAGGYAFSLALKHDGTLSAWGDNTDGQTAIPASSTQITHIACGAGHALALRADFIPAQVARLDQDNIFTGKVGIQRAPATNNLEVEGSASKTTAGNWLANSDRRIKTDVRPVTGALRKLARVNLVDFHYSEAYRAAHPEVGGRRYLNVIAQEFAEVFPDHVQNSGEVLPDGSPILQVDTYPLTIYSAAAVQELAKENQALKKKLADQEERLKRLEALIK